MNAVRTHHFTKPIPEGLLAPAPRQGRVERLPYGDGKTAKVYLPRDYDRSEGFPVLYLAHGWCATAGDYFGSCPLAALLAERAAGKDFLLCAAVGDQDPLFDQMDRQLAAMGEFPDCFTGKHLRCFVKKDGLHDLDAVLEYLYNALPLFFGGKKENG